MGNNDNNRYNNNNKTSNSNTAKKATGSVNIGKNFENSNLDGMGNKNNAVNKEVTKNNNSFDSSTINSDNKPDKSVDMPKAKRLESRNGIKLNRKMRMWNKYKKLCYVCVGAAAAVVICIAGYKGITGANSSEDNQSVNKETDANNNTQTTLSENVAQNNTNQTSQAGDNLQNNNQTTQATQVQNVAFSPLSVVGPASKQEYTSRAYYDGSIFIGDSILDGIAYYKYLDSPRILADGNNTTTKSDQYIQSAISLQPAKVFIMVGLNDVNYGTKSAQAIAEGIMEIAKKVKAGSPATNVYVLSILPITQEFEAKANINAKQTVIDEVNNLVMSACQPNSVTYIDVATAFKDNTGYMNPQYTGNGSNIYNEYYPFLLNGIAGVVR